MSVEKGGNESKNCTSFFFSVILPLSEVLHTLSEDEQHNLSGIGTSLLSDFVVVWPDLRTPKCVLRHLCFCGKTETRLRNTTS